MQRYYELKRSVENALYIEAEAWIERYRPYIQQLEAAIAEAASHPEVKAKLQDAYDAMITYRDEMSDRLQALRQEQREAATVVKAKLDDALSALETEVQHLPAQS